ISTRPIGRTRSGDSDHGQAAGDWALHVPAPIGYAPASRLSLGVEAVVQSFKQELVGVFGHPVAENPTQAMIEPAFAAMGLDWRYLTVEVLPAALGDAVKGALAMNWRGFNCTIPHK